LPGELSDAIGETSLRQRLPQVEVSAGENVRAAVLRVLNDPTEDDLSIFRDLGRQQELDVYLQRAGPGTIRAIDPSGVGQLAYSLPDFDLTLHFSPTDFLQVNAEVNAALVTQTLRLLEIQKNDRVLDLYCGLGNFSLPLARHAGEVLGVEGESGLVARAAGNAHLNKIDNVSFIAGDLNQLEWSFMRGAWDLVVLDPPRSGAQAVVSQMAQIAPRRIAYVSCHPATLARDAKELIKSAGYQLIAVGIADMFPHTHHVESIALFEKSKGI
jgi:23S rRNA (uracil1939-C5)-methyltransferase